MTADARGLELAPLAPPAAALPAQSLVVPGPAGCRSRTGCGRTAPVTDPGTAARIADHPCYSADAHQYYARMHVAVAPSCNIQCNYCNRKYDCSNESRPGVTSGLLTPEDAVAKVKYVANEIKQMSVLGVAGPGDPLANPRRTFRTLELVRRACPDLKLCLSTNGLRLAEYADRIADLGIEHVTVTINMTDPDIGARIYEWVAWRGGLYRGREAARILSERQLEGVRALVDRQILVKVNSVLIPGINDDHLPEVSRVVREMGVFLHNVMPLVSAPEHGTVFGLAGQRGPTPAELRALQDRCAAGESMSVMRHCRQCRADAVGLLGQDHGEQYGPEAYQGREISYDLAGRERLRAEIERWREGAQQARESLGINANGAERPERVVLVAVATKGGGVVNQHFGHATEFWIYEAAEGWAKLAQIRQAARYCGPTAEGTKGPTGGDTPDSPLDSTVRLLSDCAAVLCSKIGPAPREALAAAGIQPMEVYDLVEQAVAAAGAALIRDPANQAGPIPSRGVTS